MRTMLTIISAVAVALPLAVSVPVSAQAQAVTLRKCMDLKEREGMVRWWAYYWCRKNGYTQ